MRRYEKVFLICFFILFLCISVSSAQQVDVPLIGTGIGIPNISVTPTSYNFGNVNLGSSSSPITFAVSNTGSANLVIGTISITGTDASQFSKQNDTCSGQTLAPSSSCTINVVFSPASKGSKNASLLIPSNDPDTPTLNVPLSGIGVGIPNISVIPISYNFGNVNVGSSSTPQTFTVSNTGTGDLIIGTISFAGTDASHFGKQSDNCSGQTLAPSSNCTLQAVFTPTSAGSKSANLTIPSNDPDTPTLNVPLSGTGVQTIAVTVPNGGESWEAGTTYTIRWTYTGNPGSKVKIELLKGGSVNRIIISSTSIGSGGNGSYNWTIPATQAGGTDYKIKVTCTSNSSYTDTSDNNFTIIAATITVTVPNGGESWKAGTTQTIRWTYTANPGSNVKIELLKGGSLNKTIKSSTSIGSGGNGLYNWAIPSNQTAGTDYKIRITSTSSSTINDTSDNNFIISKESSVRKEFLALILRWQR
ncbi:MAG: choice-of-anchor D domain-containing protein [Nitrospirota bacterium]